MSQVPGKSVSPRDLLSEEDLPDEPLEIVFAEDVKSRQKTEEIAADSPPKRSAEPEQSARDDGRVEG